VAIVVLAHVALLVVNVVNNNADRANDPGSRWLVPWQPLVAIPLSVVPLLTFAGFYLAARRARVAIMASFLMTFLAMLPFALTIPELSEAATAQFAGDLVRQFTSVVGVVVAFYFGSEAVITGIRLVTIGKNVEAASQLRLADRDLAVIPRSRAATEPAGGR
jgi:hypothetical protein